MMQSNSAKKLPMKFGSEDIDGVSDAESVDKEFVDEFVGNLEGTATGEIVHAIVPGGWTGTDDATSTAPSDLVGVEINPREEENQEEQDITGRAAAGGLHHIDGGVTDIKGTPVEDSRNWEKNPIVESK